MWPEDSDFEPRAVSGWGFWSTVMLMFIVMGTFLIAWMSEGTVSEWAYAIGLILIGALFTSAVWWWQYNKLQDRYDDERDWRKVGARTFTERRRY